MQESKRSRIIAGVLSLVLLTVIGIGIDNAVRPIPAIAANIKTLPHSSGSAIFNWPTKGEASVAGIGYGTLATYGGTRQLPTASVAKIITSLAVLQKDPLSPGSQGSTYTVTADDVARYNDYVAKDGSVVVVSEGERLTEYQALEALMLPSANNIADSLATWVFGSFSNYRSYATQMLQSLGATNTIIGSDASGLSPDTLSTPSDLIKLGTAVLNNPVLTQIVSQSSATLPIVGTVHNVDWLLGSHGVIGIKTGNSDEAGGCFLFASKQQIGDSTVTLVGAVMGTADLTSALSSSAALIDSVAATFSPVTPVTKGETIGSYTLPWGGSVTAVAQDNINFIHWNGDDLTAQAKLGTVNHALKSGDKLGTLTVTADGHTHEVTLATKSAVPGPSLWWRITRH